MRGRKKTPTATLEARGSWRAKTRPNEPEVDVALPDCPAWMSDAAKAEWGHLGPQLLNLGIMSEVYAPALAKLADAMARFITACRNLDKVGDVEYTEKGTSQLSGAHRAWQSAGDRLMKTLVQFGMTPSAMSSIDKTAKPEGEADPRLRLLQPKERKKRA